MEDNVISVNTHEDKEVVADLFQKYDLVVLPVVLELWFQFLS